MSKFDKLFEARESVSKEKPPRTIKTKDVQKKPEDPPSAVPPELARREEDLPQNNPKPRGRPKAKRSDPDFIGFTTYIRKDTHLNVKIALLREGKGRELSQLVEELLADWVKDKRFSDV